jgi:hypothetical protein
VGGAGSTHPSHRGKPLFLNSKQEKVACMYNFCFGLMQMCRRGTQALIGQGGQSRGIGFSVR